MLHSNAVLKDLIQLDTCSIADRTVQFATYKDSEKLFVYSQAIDAINLTMSNTYVTLREQGIAEDTLLILERIKLDIIDQLTY